MSFRTTILIVDDEKELVKALARRLRLKGYNIMTAYCGKDALSFLQTADIDVVVTDLRMPGEVNGSTLVERIEAMGDHAPKIVLMSGYADELEAMHVASEAINKLAKPFQIQELLDLIA